MPFDVERENNSSGKVRTLPDQASGAKLAAKMLGYKSAPSKGSGGGGMHIKIPAIRDQSKVK